MAILKQSTARNRTFLMVDSSDHLTGKTGLTVTLTLSKNAAAFGAAGGSVTEISSGWYSVALNTTDTNTLGDLAYHATATGADPSDWADDVCVDIPGGSVSSVTGAVGSVTGNVGGNVVGSVASVTARVTANTDQLAGQTVTAGAGVTFPSSVASPTNITAGTITTVTTTTTATNLTNAPTNGDFTAAMKTSLNAATPASVTGAVGSVTGAVGSVTGAVGSVTGNVGGNVVGSVASVTAAVTLSAKDSFVTRNATAAAGAASTITLDASASAVDSFYVGQQVKIDSATGAGQVRTIITYVGATKVATVDRAWQTNPDNTSVFTVVADEAAKLNSSLEVIAASVTGAVASVTGAVGSVTGLTASNLDATISSRMATYTQPTGFLAATFPGTVASPTNITAGTITTATNVTNVSAGGIVAASFGVSAIDASALATDAGQEIADRILVRAVAGGSDAGRTIKMALQRLVNRVGIAAGTMTVYAADDSTTSWTAAVTTSAGNPVSDVDPT